MTIFFTSIPINLKYSIPPFTARFIAYLVLNIDIESGGRYRMKPYKRDDFNSYIGNGPFLYSNIPAATVYGVDTSQVI